jgi:hypothetical protein
MPEVPKPEIKLFSCYAHEDKVLRDKLQVHLSDLKRRGSGTTKQDMVNSEEQSVLKKRCLSW